MQISAQLVLVRLLAPDDFGLVGMAMFFIGIGQLVADFGIGSAIVQGRTVDRVVLSSCFWLNMAVALGLSAIVLACAPLIAMFYSRSDLAPIIALLSLNLLLSGLQVMPTALLYRDMRFAELAQAQVAGTAAGALVAIAMAWSGAGVWALAVQPLVGSASALALYWWRTRWRPTFEFDWPRVKPLARFSFALLGTNLVGYGNRNVDSLLIGRFLGAGPLGLYALAIQIMLYPLQQISSVIVRVLFPTLVHIRDELPRLRAAYLKAVHAIAIVTFPLMCGLFVLADDFVLVVFGARWLDMVPVLKLLSLVGLLQSVGTTVGTIYLTAGRADIALRVSVVATVVLTLAVAGGLPWGIRGVATGYAGANFALFYYTLAKAFPLVGLRVAEFHAVLVRPLCAAVVMAVLVWVALPLTAAWPAAARLGAGIAAGSAIYLILVAALDRHQLVELWRTARPAS